MSMSILPPAAPPKLSKTSARITNPAAQPTQARLRELLNYDPVTGWLSWVNPPKLGRRSAPGQSIGTLNNMGYRILKIDGRIYTNHRLIWILVNGPISDGMIMDHINGNSDDNRIENLRLCSHQQNMMNRRTFRRNKSGTKGLSWHKGAWTVAICHNKKRMYGGRFKNKEDAVAAYNALAEKLFGEFAHKSEVSAE